MRDLYEDLFGLVAAVIRAWDPLGLLAAGAPGDEFDGEIARVVARVEEIRGRADAIRVVDEIFSPAFAPLRFEPQEIAAAGEQLFDALERAGYGEA